MTLYRRFLPILLAAALLVSGCQAQQPSSSNSPSISVLPSSPEPSESSAPEPSSTPPSSNSQDRETASFCLGTDTANAQTLGAGDTLGQWTLADLKIDYSQGQEINMLEAVWEGEVVLEGVITRNGLVELGYDFVVSDGDYAQMPVYLLPEMDGKKQNLFMLDIPQGLENAPDLTFEQQQRYRITVSSYRSIFAYMMAPPGAVVTKLEPLGEPEPIPVAVPMTMQVTDQSGGQLDTTVTVLLAPPQGWTVSGSRLLLDGNTVAELLAVYPSQGFDWEAITVDHPGVESVQSVTLGDFQGQCLLTQQELTGGGMTTTVNQRYYFLDNGQLVVKLGFYPLMGMGGASTQREAFEACLTGMQVG